MLETEKSLNKMINVFNEIANLYILDIAKICNCLIFFTFIHLVLIKDLRGQF